MALRPATQLLATALAVLDAERVRLDALGVPGELVLVGGSSVPGALTHGDVDLHLRVPAPDFAEVVAALREVYPVVHPEIWSATLATFTVPRHTAADLPTGLAATPRGSVHDVRFTRSWQRLRADPKLVEQYNAMKLAEDGPDGAQYEARKSAFFDRLLAE
jgi:GrpB-like predicted nucleotidyltransferase (UPF0157 family)